MTAPLPTAQTETNVRPEWIRLPAPGTRCPHTGLQRAFIESLILPRESNGNPPPVRSCLIKKPGAIRGCRLVSLSSLNAFIHRISEEQAKELFVKAS